MLKLTNIRKRFDDKLIFDGFSYTFQDQGIYLIRGESGVGKTTLLRMIAGLDNGAGKKKISKGSLWGDALEIRLVLWVDLYSQTNR